MRDLHELIQQIEHSLGHIEAYVKKGPPSAEPANDDEMRKLRAQNKALMDARKDMADRIDQTIKRLRTLAGSQ